MILGKLKITTSRQIYYRLKDKGLYLLCSSLYQQPIEKLIKILRSKFDYNWKIILKIPKKHQVFKLNY